MLDVLGLLCHLSSDGGGVRLNLGVLGEQHAKSECAYIVSAAFIEPRSS